MALVVMGLTKQTPCAKDVCSWRFFLSAVCRGRKPQINKSGGSVKGKQVESDRRKRKISLAQIGTNATGEFTESRDKKKKWTAKITRGRYTAPTNHRKHKNAKKPPKTRRLTRTITESPVVLCDRALTIS